MAFEVPLEADRVNDLNLFSTFVRAPVIGTILWILGGDKAKLAEEEGKEQIFDDDDDCDHCTNHNLNHSSASTMKRVLSKQPHSLLKKSAPSLIGSEVSDSEVCESLDAMCLYNERSAKYIPGLTKKELSWSDEIGKDLVDYGEEVSVASCD